MWGDFYEQVEQLVLNAYTTENWQLTEIYILSAVMLFCAVIPSMVKFYLSK